MSATPSGQLLYWDMSFTPYMTMADARRDLPRRGFTASFEPIGKALHVAGNETMYQPGDLTIAATVRYQACSATDCLICSFRASDSADITSHAPLGRG